MKCSCCGKENEGAYGKCDSCTTRDSHKIGSTVGTKKLPREKIKHVY